MYINDNGEADEVKLIDSWEIFIHDKSEQELRLIRHFNSCIKNCNSSKDARLQEMINSPQVLRQ